MLFQSSGVSFNNGCSSWQIFLPLTTSITFGSWTDIAEFGLCFPLIYFPEAMLSNFLKNYLSSSIPCFPFLSPLNMSSLLVVSLRLDTGLPSFGEITDLCYFGVFAWLQSVCVFFSGCFNKSFYPGVTGEMA